MDLSVRISQANRRALILGITYAQLLLSLIGIIFLILAGFAWCLQRPNLTALFLGVGTSLVATLIASYLFNARENLLDSIVDYGLVQVWADRKGRQPVDQQPINWVKLVRDADERCTLLGVALSGFSIDDREEFSSAVMALTNHVTFTVLLLDPTSDVAKLRAAEEKAFREDTEARIRKSLVAFWEIHESLPDERKAKFKIYVYSEVPTFSLVWVDRYMIVTHYLPATRNANSPAYALWDMRPFKPQEKMLYAIFERNVAAILRSPRTTEIQAENLAAYGPKAE